MMAAIGLTALPATADSPPDPVPISAPTHTLVTLNFTGNGCVGCFVRPQQYIPARNNNGQEISWDGQGRKVRGDSITFRVPTENTRGMSFAIANPAYDDGFYDAEPVIVFQYKGYEPGTRVERSQAIKASSASPCWAGTTDDKVSLDVNVRKVRVEGIKMVDNQPTGGPTPVRVTLAWVAPTEEVFGGFTKTDRGVVAVQDTYPCGKKS